MAGGEKLLDSDLERGRDSRGGRGDLAGSVMSETLPGCWGVGEILEIVTDFRPEKKPQALNLQSGRFSFNLGFSVLVCLYLRL
ncbi:unnamed protein product [Linum trigynum]|uniref:Uncharacterized protein n=1 Tax=Linum trigynum TaxID=586398 RepID=A0AAV2GNW4_9ROSI